MPNHSPSATLWGQLCTGIYTTPVVTHTHAHTCTSTHTHTYTHTRHTNTHMHTHTNTHTHVTHDTLIHTNTYTQSAITTQTTSLASGVCGSESSGQRHPPRKRWHSEWGVRGQQGTGKGPKIRDSKLSVHGAEVGKKAGEGVKGIRSQAEV
jgi:hypothetical protein